jgi:hypothetical protein
VRHALLPAPITCQLDDVTWWHGYVLWPFSFRKTNLEIHIYKQSFWAIRS